MSPWVVLALKFGATVPSRSRGCSPVAGVANVRWRSVGLCWTHWRRMGWFKAVSGREAARENKNAIMNEMWYSYAAYGTQLSFVKK